MLDERGLQFMVKRDPPFVPVFGDSTRDKQADIEPAVRAERHGPGQSGHLAGPKPCTDGKENKNSVAERMTLATDVTEKATHVCRRQHASGLWHEEASMWRTAKALCHYTNTMLQLCQRCCQRLCSRFREGPASGHSTPQCRFRKPDIR
jgi:hypothetical protein